MLETTCPECGKEHSLEFSQTADIRYRVDGQNLVPDLHEDSVGWHDSTYLYCRNCGLSDADSDMLSEIKFEYDHHI